MDSVKDGLHFLNWSFLLVVVGLWTDDGVVLA